MLSNLCRIIVGLSLLLAGAIHSFNGNCVAAGGVLGLAGCAGRLLSPH